jgi:CDP-glucose 4,6-dehydratase
MFEQLQQAYSGKRVFVTGHTGFKGSWLIKILQQLGAHIKGYALAPETSNDLYHLIDGDGICESVIGDLRDQTLLMSAIQSSQPEFIFHLAAQPLVRLSYDKPSETFAVNAIGTAHVLDALRLLPNRCTAVMITTDKVYHNCEWDYPYRENDRLGGYDPYSASKACAELIIESYRNSFFNTQQFDQHQKAIAVARAGNVIGGGDWSKDRLIPDIAKALSKNEKIKVRNPASIRPWQHVLEPLFGYLQLGAALYADPVKFSGAYNFGPRSEDALTVQELVEMAIAKWGSGQYDHLTIEKAVHEAGLLKLDISKAQAELGWSPLMNAKQAVGLSIEWYNTYFQQRLQSSTLVDMQIAQYASLLGSVELSSNKLDSAIS